MEADSIDTMNCNGVKEMGIGYVYFIRSGKTNYFKIGKTQHDIKDRLRQLQTGNPEELTVFAYIKTYNMDCLEQLFRYDGESIRVRRDGEWFRFHPLDLIDTLEYFVEEKFAMDYTLHIYRPNGKEELVIEADIDELKKEYESTSV